MSEKASLLKGLGSVIGSAFKKIGGFLNTPRMISPQLAAGVIGGVGFGMGKKVGKGLFAFLRSFFPYDVYDLFILITIFQHIFIDGIMFGYSYISSVYAIHFWIALFFVMIFSILRNEGEGFLTALFRNIIAFGLILVIEVYFFPLLSRMINNPYFLVNRILLPIWPLFALLYSSYKRPSTTPFVRKIIAIFLIFLALMSWPYIQRISSQISVPGLNPGEQIQAKIAMKSITERLKEGSKAFWGSFKNSIINPIKRLINGSWINERIAPFQSDRGQYDAKQQALEVKITSALPLPPYVDENEKIELKISASFKGASQNQIPREILNNTEKYTIRIDSISGDIDNSYSINCDKPASLRNALSYQILNCEIPSEAISFDKSYQASLKANVIYEFSTFASREFYFMQQQKLYEYIAQNKNPYLEESGFLNGPQSTKSSSGPVVVGLSANGEMSEYPIQISTKNNKHMFILSVRNSGSGRFKEIKNVKILAPKEIHLSDCGLEETGKNCFSDFGFDDTSTLQGAYHCFESIEEVNLIKQGDQYILPCIMTIDSNILSESYKAVLPVYTKIKYEYEISSPAVKVIKKKTLSAKADEEFVEKIEKTEFSNNKVSKTYAELIGDYPILYSTAQKVAEENNFDPALLMGLATIEGGIQQKHRLGEKENGKEIKITNSEGLKNIKGVCQVSDAVWEDFGEGYEWEDMNKYEPNMVVAVRYLKNLIKRYNNNLGVALLAYNWGPSNVDNFLEKYPGARDKEKLGETLENAAAAADIHIPDQSRFYPRRVLETAAYFKEVLEKANLYQSKVYNYYLNSPYFASLPKLGFDDPVILGDSYTT